MWNPLKYDNLTWLAISSSNIWLPDIAIINSPEPYELTRKSTNVDVDYRGEVGFFPSGRLATRCNLQITYFPFDWQHCEVRLESWIYPTQYLEIEMYPDDTVDLKEYYTNHQWAVAGYRVLPEVADYDGKNFSSITFTFVLRRKSEYYFMYFIFPQLLLALLQTLSHTLPVEHPGRMAMLTSLFIGTSVTQAGIAVHIPKSSDSMSLLQIYMTIMSINLVFALIVSFVMMYAVLRYPNEEPNFIAMLVAFFSIVWPNEVAKHRHHKHNPTPAAIAKSNVTMGVKSSSPFTPKHRPAKSKRATSRDRDRDRDHERERSRSKHRNRVSNRYYDQEKSYSLGRDGDLTNFRQLVKRRRMTGPNSSPENIRKVVTYLGEGGESNNNNFPSDDETFIQRGHKTVPPRGKSVLGKNVMPVACESDINEEYVVDPLGLYSPKKESQGNGILPSADLLKTQRRNLWERRRSGRGEAASAEDTRELKRRWLLYCVALDKTIMYVNMVCFKFLNLMFFVVNFYPLLSIGLEYCCASPAVCSYSRAVASSVSSRCYRKLKKNWSIFTKLGIKNINKIKINSISFLFGDIYLPPFEKHVKRSFGNLKITRKLALSLLRPKYLRPDLENILILYRILQRRRKHGSIKNRLDYFEIWNFKNLPHRMAVEIF